MKCLKCETDKEAGATLKSVCRVCCVALSGEAKKGARRDRVENRKGEDYSSRNANLRRMGFASYAAYLKSDLWKAVRVLVYKAKGRNCYLCGSEATVLHHNRYHENDLSGRRLRFISPICRRCHESVEFRDGKKSTLAQAKSTFRRARKNGRVVLSLPRTGARTQAMYAKRAAKEKAKRDRKAAKKVAAAATKTGV